MVGALKYTQKAFFSVLPLLSEAVSISFISAKRDSYSIRGCCNAALRDMEHPRGDLSGLKVLFAEIFGVRGSLEAPLYKVMV